MIRKKLKMCWVSYKWNRNVLSLFLSVASEMSGCTKFSRKTVPDPRSLNNKAVVAIVCSGTYSQSAGVSRSKTPAGDC